VILLTSPPRFVPLQKQDETVGEFVTVTEPFSSELADEWNQCQVNALSAPPSEGGVAAPKKIVALPKTRRGRVVINKNVFFFNPPPLLQRG